MAADRFGRVHVVWQGPDFSILYAQVNSDGAISIPATKVFDTARAGVPRIAVDDTGNAHVVFALPGLSGVIYIKIAEGERVLTSAFKMFPPNTVFELEQDNWPSVSINPITQLPVVAADVSTSYTEQFGFPFPIPITWWNEYVRTAALDASGKPVAYSTPYSITRISSPQFRAQYSSVAVDSLGTTHVVWVHRGPDWTGSSVGYAKEGAEGWVEIGNSRNVSGLSGRPRITADQNSNVEVVWGTTDGATIWQELDHEGLTTVDDTIVSEPTSKGRWPGVASGYGNLAVTWTDGRETPNSQIYSKSLKESFPEAIVSESPGAAFNAVLAIPSLERLAFAWQDTRSGFSQIVYREQVIAPVRENNQVVGSVRRYVPAGAPLGGVAISLTSGSWNATALTTPEGFYSFKDVPPGRYTIVPTKPGYNFDQPSLSISVRGIVEVASILAKQIVDVVAIEVNQSVQDWNNTVPLIDGKRTLVRAFVQLPLGVDSETPSLLRNFRLRMGSITIPPLGIEEKGMFEFKAERGYIRDRGKLDSSINFIISPKVASGISAIGLEWDDGLVSTASAFPFGKRPLVPVNFERQGFRAEFVFSPLTARDEVSNRVFVPGSGTMELFRSRLAAMYPISDTPETLQVVRNSYDFPINFVPISQREHQIVNKMKERAKASASKSESALEYSFVEVPEEVAEEISMRREFTRKYVPGDSTVRLRVGNGLFTGSDMDPKTARHVYAHEIGHLLRRPHTVGEEGGRVLDPNFYGPSNEVLPLLFPFAFEGDHDFMPSRYLDYSTFPNGHTFISPSRDTTSYDAVYGWDSSLFGDTSIIEPSTGELMSYTSGRRWISDYNYRKLFSNLSKQFRTGVAGKGLEGDSMMLLVTGEVDLVEEVASLDPIYSIKTPDAHLGIDDSSSFALFTIAGDGSEIMRIPVAINTSMAEAPGAAAVNSGWFRAFIPGDRSIQRIEIRKGEKIVGRVLASAHFPEVVMLYPAGGEVLPATDIEIKWRASDLDSAQIYSTVQFSADGGRGWQTLILDSEAQAAMINVPRLTGTTNGLFRVLVSDGVNSSSTITERPVTIGNKPPSISIKSPKARQSFVGEQAVILEAFSEDLEDGFLGGTNLVWISSRDGVVGTGSFSVKNLSEFSEGVHEIEVVAYDSTGATNAATVTIQIATVPPPSLAVEVVGDRLFISWDTSDAGYHLEFASSVELGWSAVEGDFTRFRGRMGMFVSQDSEQRFFRLKKEAAR